MKLQKASKDDDDGDGDDDGVTSIQAGRLKTRQRGVAAGGRSGWLPPARLHLLTKTFTQKLCRRKIEGSSGTKAKE